MHVHHCLASIRMRTPQSFAPKVKTRYIFMHILFWTSDISTHTCTPLHGDSTEKRKRHSCAPVLHIIITAQSQHGANFQMITFLFSAKSNKTVLMWILRGFYPLFPLAGGCATQPRTRSQKGREKNKIIYKTKRIVYKIHNTNNKPQQTVKSTKKMSQKSQNEPKESKLAKRVKISQNVQKQTQTWIYGGRQI